MLQNIHRTRSDTELGFWKIFRIAMMVIMDMTEDHQIDLVGIKSASFELRCNTWLQPERSTATDMFLQGFWVAILCFAKTQIEHHSKWSFAIGAEEWRAWMRDEEGQGRNSALGSFGGRMDEEVVGQGNEAAWNGRDGYIGLVG